LSRHGLVRCTCPLTGVKRTAHSYRTMPADDPDIGCRCSQSLRRYYCNHGSWKWGVMMRIHNIYADENGETHFRDIEIELSDAGADGITSKRFPASGIIFRTTPADWFFDWHPATRRQYVINLDAPHKVTASDGETRIIG